MNRYRAGVSLVHALVDKCVRTFTVLDGLLIQWEKIIYNTLRMQNTGVQNDKVYMALMTMILTDPIQLRIVNDVIYFQTNSTIRMTVNRNDHATLLNYWFLVFKSQIVVDSTEQKFDFLECMFDKEIENKFPRFHMCARYMCLSIRQTAAATKHDNVVVVPVFFNVWHQFYNAVLLMTQTTHTAAVAHRLLAILTTRHFDIYTTWDPANEVYPGARLDDKSN